MASWQQPVTDRTARDVSRGTEKGCLNASDLRRVEGNTAYIESLLFHGGMEPVKIDWEEGDFLFEEDMCRIEANVRMLRKKFAGEGWPEMPEAPLNHWQKWNQLEMILEKVCIVAERNAFDARQYVGEVCIPNEIGVL